MKITIALLLFSHILFGQHTNETKVWLVAVGVGSYQQSTIMSNLDFTIQGAYDFVRLFEQRQLVTVKRPLINQRAKRSDILNTMRYTFITNPDIHSEDMIIFYFSGHGEIAGGEEGICPYDYNPNDVRSLIQNSEIEKIMSESPARHKVCFIESCKTEVQTQRIIDPSILQEFNERRRNISNSLIFISSTRSGKPSFGNPNNIGGYFTYFLLEGLKGEANTDDDAYITVKELFNYVKKEVADYTNGLQIPQINNLNRYNPDLPLMIMPKKMPVRNFAYKTRSYNGLRWMTQNLNLDIEDSWCYNNDSENCIKYGRLYSWEAAKKACESLGDNWRLPTDEDWRNLVNGFGGEGNRDASDGGEAAYFEMITGGNSKFSVTLNGYRGPYGKFYDFGEECIFWTASESGVKSAYVYGFQYFPPRDRKELRRYDLLKGHGNSCRCVQD